MHESLNSTDLQADGKQTLAASSRYRSWAMVELERRLRGRVPNGQLRELLGEAEDHLESAFVAGLELGLTDFDADLLAVQQFGEPKKFARAVGSEVPNLAHNLAQVFVALLPASLVAAIVLEDSSLLLLKIAAAGLLVSSLLASKPRWLNFLRSATVGAVVALVGYGTCVVDTGELDGFSIDSRWAAREFVQTADLRLAENEVLVSRLTAGMQKVYSSEWSIAETSFKHWGKAMGRPFIYPLKTGEKSWIARRIDFKETDNPVLAKEAWSQLGGPALATVQSNIKTHAQDVRRYQQGLDRPPYAIAYSIIFSFSALSMAICLLALLLAELSWRGRRVFRDWLSCRWRRSVSP